MKRYDKYKDSGVDWIGEIPEGWEVRKLKFDFITRKGLTITKENLVNEGVFCLNYGEIHSRFPFKINPLVDELKCVSREYLTTNSSSIIKKGEFAFADTSEDIEGSGNFSHLTTDVELFAGYHTVIVRPKNEINSLFFAFLFESLTFRNQIRSAVKGVKVYSITQGMLNNLSFWTPPLPEQQAIATFLDDKTAKIDQTISIKQKEIELLKERRQILIQKAVTKGLNQDAPDLKMNRISNDENNPEILKSSKSGFRQMKDSGVDWIGEIPEHWEVRKLRYLGQTQNGISKGGDFFGTGNPFLSYGDVYKNSQVPNNINGLVESTADEIKQYSVKEGDVFFTRTSETKDDIGVSSVCYQDIPNATFAGFLIRFRPYKNLLLKNFSKYFFRIDLVSSFFTKEMNIVTRASLSQELLKSLSVVLPPIREQFEIGLHLEKLESKIGKAISLKEQEIEKLKEYKMVLIDNVVTGKVKVV